MFAKEVEQVLIIYPQRIVGRPVRLAFGGIRMELLYVPVEVGFRQEETDEVGLGHARHPGAHLDLVFEEAVDVNDVVKNAAVEGIAIGNVGQGGIVHLAPTDENELGHGHIEEALEVGQQPGHRFLPFSDAFGGEFALLIVERRVGSFPVADVVVVVRFYFVELVDDEDKFRHQKLVIDLFLHPDIVDIPKDLDKFLLDLLR